MNDAPGDYAGFVTRAIALAIDIALIDLAAVTVAIVIGLGISAFELPDITVTITIAVGALVYRAWFAGYSATVWSTTGQTPGARVMGVRGVPVRVQASLMFQSDESAIPVG
jgi:uncharacterized RDD family membrane protein YckC